MPLQGQKSLVLFSFSSLTLPIRQAPAYGPPSNYSVPLVLTQVRKLVKSVKNGKLYQAVLPNPLWANGSQTVYEIHMFGSSFEQGKQAAGRMRWK